MLLAQTASQLDKQVSDDFWKTMFPSGNVDRRSVMMKTVAELNIQTNDKPASSTVQVAPNEPITMPAQDETKSRKQRRHEESIKKKLDKMETDRQKALQRSETVAQETLKRLRQKLKDETKEEMPERIKRILGI